jgi:hypothetical protein
MTDDESISFAFAIPADADFPSLAFDGVQVSEEPPPDDQGILPLVALLVVLVPPGLALLTKVVNEVVHSWKGHGVLLDATSDKPLVKPMPGTPYGTIVILSKNGEQATRTDIAGEDLSKYIGAAITALAGGAGASDADHAGAEASDSDSAAADEPNPDGN